MPDDERTKSDIAMLVALFESPELMADTEQLARYVNQLLALDDTAFEALARSVRARLRN